jgi:hypothetical protein
MARRPDFGKKEEIWSRVDLKEIARNLAVLSEPAVREVHQRASHECASIAAIPFCAIDAGTSHDVETVAEVEALTPLARMPSIDYEPSSTMTLPPPV